MAGSAASISVVSGEPQSAPINTAFGKPLVAKVIDMNGLPVSGVTVTFLPQGQRATGSFAGGVNTAVTDVNGNATSATFTAGGTDGNYLVAASTVQADANTLAADLAALEATCDTLYNYGAGDVVDFLRQNARQTRLGYLPRVSAGGNTAPELLAIWAAQPGARDLRAVDQRLITATPTGQYAQLS